MSFSKQYIGKMNKQAILWETLMKAIVTIVVGLVVIGILFWPGNLLKKATGFDITKYVRFGGGIITKEEAAIPADILAVNNNLISAFQQKGSDCLIAMPAINADFTAHQIWMQRAPDGMWLLIKKKEGGVITEVKSQKIENVKPCAIYGKKELDIVPEIFYNVKLEGGANFINKCLKKPGLTRAFCRPSVATQMYNEVDVLPLTGNEEFSDGQSSIDDNNLQYNGKLINLLYKPKEDVVCFISTFYGDLLGGCNAKEHGVDDDCLEGLLPNGQYNKFDENGKLDTPLCSEDALCATFKKCEDIDNLKLCLKNICGLKCQVDVRINKCVRA